MGSVLDLTFGTVEGNSGVGIDFLIPPRRLVVTVSSIKHEQAGVTCHSPLFHSADLAGYQRWGGFSSHRRYHRATDQILG